MGAARGRDGALMEEKRNGGVIEPENFAIVGTGQPEAFYIPGGAQVFVDARPFPTTTIELKAFVREEVDRAIDEIVRRIRMNTGWGS